MIAASTSRFAEAARVVAVAAVAFAASGCFTLQRDHEALAANNDALEKTVDTQKQELAAVKADIDATRQRLDNALRANADTGNDVMGEKARLNALVGRMDEASHSIDELRKELASTRGEIDARLDEMKRTQEASQAPKPPPVTIPADKTAHFAAIEAAYAQKDWGLTRTLGREFVNRYPTDEKADDVYFVMGDADLKDGRPASALGEFNRVLKATPPSNVLDKTLFAMGDAYLAMHDCANARLAYDSCNKRFPKEKLGTDAKTRVASIDHPTPGMCAPP